MLSPADFRDAWDAILSCRDERDLENILEFVAERDRIPFVCIALTSLAAAIAKELQVEESFAQKLTEMPEHLNPLRSLLAFVQQLLESAEPKFDPQKVGVSELFKRIPEKYGFKDYLSDTTGFPGDDAE
jgi:hypothetical protein